MEQKISIFDKFQRIITGISQVLTMKIKHYPHRKNDINFINFRCFHNLWFVCIIEVLKSILVFCREFVSLVIDAKITIPHPPPPDCHCFLYPPPVIVFINHPPPGCHCFYTSPPPIVQTKIDINITYVSNTCS